MARNRRGQKRAQESSDSSRKPGDGQPSSPFASIVLKEKKEPEKKSEPAVRPKKPGQIVQGYNPSDSFADILYNWEHTGNPYAMPHEKKRGGNEAEEKSRKSFGDILAAWEGRSGKKEEKGAYRRVSPSYSPSKDFGSILAAFEGDDGKPASSGRVRPSGKSEGVSAHPADAASAEPDEAGKEADKPTVSLFKKMEDDDEIPSAVSWSVFSGAREIERPEPLQEEEKKAVSKTPDRPRGAGYQASVSFGEILRRYDESLTPVRQQKKIEEPEAGVPEGATVDLFRKMEEYAPQKGTFVVGTVKTMAPKYGIDTLIKAFSTVSKKHGGAALKLVIVGDGPNLEEYRQLAASLALENVEFRGRVENSLLPQIYNSFSVAASLSNSESFGVVAVEAMACQCPVITSDADGFTEVVEDGVTGIIVPKGDVQAAAMAIEYFMGNPGIGERMGAAGRERVLRLYKWKDNVASMVETYRNCITEYEQ